MLNLLDIEFLNSISFRLTIRNVNYNLRELSNLSINVLD